MKLSLKRINRKKIPLYANFIIFVLIYALGAIFYRKFLSLRVLVNLFTDNSFLGITAVGMTLVIISGGIDLSVGSMMVFTTMIIALFTETLHLPPIVVLPAVILIGILFGSLMGGIIHFFNAPPFIVTLSGMFLARGLGFVISLDSIPIKHKFYDNASQFGIQLTEKIRMPIIAIIFIAVVIIGIIISHYTKFGRNTYAIGGNEQSAVLMGLPVGRIKILIYAFSGMCSALAGIVYVLYTLSGYGLAYMGLELDSVAAVVIGGTLLTGGVGYVEGTLVGVLIQGLIYNFITFQGTLNVWWAKIVIGLLLLFFILMQRTFSTRTVTN
jgi:ribose/xylose/arabinose/galactoside ABC-type transport system permease subunit